LFLQEQIKDIIAIARDLVGSAFALAEEEEEEEVESEATPLLMTLRLIFPRHALL
jgi:hypothetical protein